MNNLSPTQSSNVAANVLLIAAWFGLVSGLFEGVIFLAVQKLDSVMHVGLEIVWVSALFNLLLFTMVGLTVVALTKVFPQLPIYHVAVFLFALLAFSDWLAVLLYRRIHEYAILSLAAGFAVQFTRWFNKHDAGVVHFWSRSLPGVAGVAALALVGIQGGLWLQERMAIARLPAAPPGSPNVLVIVLDALRADHLSSYGYDRLTSPNIDRIAGQGVLFNNAFGTSSWTAPSHASLLTGRYPYDHGVDWDNSRTLVSDPPTLGEVLRRLGYRTAAFSANVFWFTRAHGFSRGFIHFEDYFHSVTDMVLRTLYGRAFEQLVLRRLGFEDIPARKRATDINRSMLRWLHKDGNKPFFVVLNYMDTHDPYLPPQPFRNKFSSLNNPGGILNWRVGRNRPQMASEQLQAEIDAYDGAIAYVDNEIGQLLKELQEQGFVENTLVIITADHGESFGEHDHYLHGNSLYREEIHVPLILWWLGRVPAGIRVSEPVTNAAVPATVMEIIGVDHSAVFAVPPLTQLWGAPEFRGDWPDALAELAQIPWKPENAAIRDGSMKSLVNRHWHFILHEKLGTELYDRKRDPQQLHNLAQRSEMQGVVAEFRSRLQFIVSSGKTTAERRF